MASVINTNPSSLNAQNNLSKTQSSLATSLQRLSTGLRINSAKDDAAGLAISERMTSQIRGLNQAGRNANDGVSLAQTAEGALGQAGDLLQRMRELAIQSSNATNSSSDRAALQAEVNQLKQEIDRVASTTEFNGLKLLDGSFTAQAFQVGANANQTINVSLAGASGSDLASYSIAASDGGKPLAATTDSAANTITAQTLTISGSAGTVNDLDIALASQASTIAALVNGKEASTGVTATAKTDVTMSAFTAGTSGLTLSSGDGTTSTVSAVVTATDVSALVDEINKKTGTTGVTATLSDDKASLTLTQADGDDIDIDNYTSSAATKTVTVTGASTDAVTLTGGAGTDSTTIAGTVTFKSDESFTVSSSDAGNAGSILTQAADTAATAAATTLRTVDVGTAAGAQSAIDVIDAALSTINGQRADLGAIQSRFDATIANLATTSENLSAARSRIRDADFAQETANLTRAQILQQAGTAMLAQANAIPQNVLSLLG